MTGRNCKTRVVTAWHYLKTEAVEAHPLVIGDELVLSLML